MGLTPSSFLRQRIECTVRRRSWHCVWVGEGKPRIERCGLEQAVEEVIDGWKSKTI
jgi:hypothetical protein